MIVLLLIRVFNWSDYIILYPALRASLLISINFPFLFRAMPITAITLSSETNLLLFIKAPSITMLAALGFPSFSAIVFTETRTMSISLLVISLSINEWFIKSVPPD